jgi:glycosyltransferase involved in cell wall biosynthesis
MLALAMVTRPDVLYVWHPPLTIGLPAWLLSRVWRAPFVLDVQDIWPDTAIHVGALQPGAITSALHVLERFVYRRAAHVITTTAAARENLLEKGVPPAKVTALPHWIDPNEWRAPMHERDAARDALGWRDRFVTLHAGNIGLLQALESAIAASSELDRRFLLVIVGDGSERARLETLLASRGLNDRVQFLSRRPPSDMPRLYAAADALLVHLKRSMFAHWSVPTKTLAYLSSGRPLIVATEGPSIDLVERARAGLVTPPESPEALARTIRELAAVPESERMAMGERGRAFVSANFSRDQVVPQYEALLRSAVVNSRR